jgi:pimeloyl-ACP methyl ester carboxylesterase
MGMNYIRRGAGKPLLLVHGIGGSSRSWQSILDDLATERDVIAIDLPGHGATLPLRGETTIATLANAVTEFLDDNNLTGVDAVGSSMGGRLVLELARRGGAVGAVVSLDPGGFWHGWQIPVFYHSVHLSVKLVRALQPLMPRIACSSIGRTLLLVQFSARPWRLSPKLVLDEMETFAASPVFDELLYNLAYGEAQKAAPPGSIKQPLVIGWGRRDRVTLPSQAQHALNLFPDARLHWFEHCGHFPQWDAPAETVRLILDGTRRNQISGTGDTLENAAKAQPGDSRFEQKNA